MKSRTKEGVERVSCQASKPYYNLIRFTEEIKMKNFSETIREIIL